MQIIVRSLPSLSQLVCHLLGRYSDTDKPIDTILSIFADHIGQLLVDMDTYRRSVALVNSCLVQFLAELRIEM